MRWGKGSSSLISAILFLLPFSVDGRHAFGEVTDNENTRAKDELYEVDVKVTMNKTEISVPVKINCVLEIPATDYVRERTETYNGKRWLCIPCT